MNDNWSVPRVLNQNLHILFRTQFSLLEKELRFYSEKERRADMDRRKLSTPTRLRTHHRRQEH